MNTNNWWRVSVLLLFGAFVIYGIPTIGLCVFSERAELTARTELSQAAGIGGQHSGDNYAVFRKARKIEIITGLAPRVLEERSGQLVVVSTGLFNGRLPTKTYASASPAYQALWHKHFL